MKHKIRLIFPMVFVALTSCATSSSDVKLAEIQDHQAVIFGHVNVYNGDDLLDGGSIYTRCTLSFTNEKGDRVAKVQTDETGWIFASVPVRISKAFRAGG